MHAIALSYFVLLSTADSTLFQYVSAALIYGIVFAVISEVFPYLKKLFG